MEEIIPLITKNWTPGGAGIWVLVVLSLVGWWKGLPSVLEAFANRQSKVEERMGQLLEDATARFTREIAAADKRHDECIHGQQELVNEVRRLRAHLGAMEADALDESDTRLWALRVLDGAPFPYTP